MKKFTKPQAEITKFDASSVATMPYSG